MVTTNPAQFDLIEELRDAQLPPPRRRRRIREQARPQVSQHKLGQALGVSAMTVHRWETNGHPGTIELATRYRELLDQLEEMAAL